MLEINIKSKLGLVVSLILATACTMILLSMTSQSVQAQENEETLQVVDQTILISQDYRFTAQPCDSLTKLVRRAIITFDDANDNIALTEEGIIYAETNIVQDMGAYLLDVGDKVVVSGEAVEKYATNSGNLSPEQIAAWGIYVPKVDFDLERTQEPENLDEVISDTNDNNTDVTIDVDEEDNDSGGDSVSALWWFAGIGSAVVIWYLLWKREED